MTSDRLLTVASKTLEFVSGEGQTHRGIKRSENQDAVLVIQSEDLRLYAVADGMGGTHGGGRASQLAIATLEECVRKVTRWDENTLIAAFQTVHDRIREDAARNPEYANMGTTLVCLALHGDSVYLANIGDSRAYLLRDGKLQRLTMDHTLVADLVRSGALSAEQAKSTPISHMLSQSLGSDAAIETDAWIGSAVASRGDVFLLCSDGLYGQVSEEEIEAICAEARAGEAVQHLVQRANEAGGIDNVSVILVHFLEGYPVTRVSGQKFSLRKIGPLPEVESTVADPESADEAAPGEIPDDAQAGLPTRISVGPIQALFFVCAAFLSGLFLGSEALVMTSAGTPAQLAVADVDAGRASLRPSKPTAVSPQQPSLAAEARRLSEHHPELRASLALYEVTHAQYVAQAEKLLTTAPSPEREKMVFELLAKFENARFELEKEVALASQLELSRDNRSTK